jgi:hypothetical protein
MTEVCNLVVFFPAGSSISRMSTVDVQLGKYWWSKVMRSRSRRLRQTNMSSYSDYDISNIQGFSVVSRPRPISHPSH